MPNLYLQIAGEAKSFSTEQVIKLLPKPLLHPLPQLPSPVEGGFSYNETLIVAINPDGCRSDVLTVLATPWGPVGLCAPLLPGTPPDATPGAVAPYLAAETKEFMRTFSRKKSSPPKNPPRASPWLLFQLGEKHFAVGTQSVARLSPPLLVQPVPSQVPAFCGIANHKGRVAGIIDLHPTLGLAPKTRPQAVIFCELGNLGMAGVPVDGLLGLKRSAMNKNQSELPFGMGSLAIDPQPTVLDLESALKNTLLMSEPF